MDIFENEPLPMWIRHVWEEEGKKRQIGLEIQIQIQIEGIGRMWFDGLVRRSRNGRAWACGRGGEWAVSGRGRHALGLARRKVAGRSEKSEVKGADGAGWHR